MTMDIIMAIFRIIASIFMIHHSMRIAPALIAIMFSVTPDIFSQYLSNDIIKIGYVYDSIIPLGATINSIEDNRNANPKLIGYSSRKKFLLIPVDQEIQLDTSLALSLHEGLGQVSKNTDTFNLEIEHFIIKRFNGRLFSYYVLESDINLISNENFYGTLTYNSKYEPSKRRTPRPDVYKIMLHDWHRQFKLDLLAISEYVDSMPQSKPANLLTHRYKRPHYLSTTVGTVIGIDFWQVDGELYFTRPETDEDGVFKAGIIRYQNHRDFEMIGFGKKSEHWNKRLNPKLLVDINSNFLIGINKWKNNENIKLQQVVQFSLSSIQSINFNTMNKSGVLIKIGLFENLYYIIEQPLRLQVGMYMCAGYKF